MSIQILQAHYGFTRMPFGRDLAPQMLHRSASHNEAVARIGWCITEQALGVITGEVGLGLHCPSFHWGCSKSPA
jgi:type II secretory pathway predicted ATPase ExeA